MVYISAWRSERQKERKTHSLEKNRERAEARRDVMDIEETGLEMIDQVTKEPRSGNISSDTEALL